MKTTSLTRSAGALWLSASLLLPACSSAPTEEGSQTPSPTPAGVDSRERISCEVVIVGGGVGGLHTAFRLAPELGEGVCLFEKEEALGGRIRDVALDESDPEAPRVGVGARRVMEGQTILLDLAAELGLTLETPTLRADFVSARGGFSFSKEGLVDRYDLEPDPSGDTETALYDLIRFSPEREDASAYGDFRSYIRAVAGSEGYWFLHDMSRFRADFEYPLDPGGYLDYLDEEWDVCCTPSYPVGGMSAFIRGMESVAEENGARIFRGEPVTVVASDTEGYRVETADHVATATRVVIAVPPIALEWIEGDIIEALTAQAILQDIIAVKVATITQWWPERWWEAVVNPEGSTDNNVWRAWTTDHCLNFIEIPMEPYAVAQNVTRSVYDDDLDCVQFWEGLAKQGTQAVEAEIKRGLEGLFSGNGVSSPATVTVPNPLKTHVQIWPDAWHWLRAGTQYTNQDLFDWAVEPLPGEDVALVGEAYNVQRSGWSDAAYKSSIHLLNTHYGMDLPGLSRTERAGRTSRSQGGH